MSSRSDPRAVSPSTSGTHSQPYEVHDSGVSLRHYIHALRRRPALVLAFTGAGLLLGIVLALLPREYKAFGSIQVRPGANNQFRVDKSELMGLSDSSTRLESEVSILQSETLAVRTIREMKLGGNPDFTRTKTVYDIDTAKGREKLLERWGKSVSVERQPRTEIIRISCTTRSPELSAKIPQALMNDYIERILRTRSESTQRVSVWLSEQLKTLKQRVEDDQTQLVALQSKLGIIGLDQQHEITTAALEQITRAEGEAKVDRILAEARYRALSSSTADLLDSNAVAGLNGVGVNSQPSLLSTLRAQQAQLKSTLSALTAKYGPNFPEVLQTEAQLATTNQGVEQEEQRILARTRQAFETAKSREQAISVMREAQEKDAFNAGGDMGRFALLQHEFETNRTLYEKLLGRLEEAGMLSGLESSDVDFVDMPSIPWKPVGLGRLAAILLCTGVGAMLGMCVTLVADGMDDSMRDIEQVESAVGLPVLASLPVISGQAKWKEKDEAYSTEHMPEALSLDTQPFRNGIGALCTSLLLGKTGARPKVIVVAGAAAGLGKSMLARNLACSLVKDSNKVLLLDGDLRHPSVHQLFGVNNSVGLGTYLNGSSGFETAIHASKLVPNLYVLPAGPENSAVLSILDDERLKELFGELREEFDFIIVDTPPALSFPDVAILGNQADCVLMVVHAHHMVRSELSRTRDLLQRSGATVSGIVINFSDVGSASYYGYYGVRSDD